MLALVIIAVTEGLFRIAFALTGYQLGTLVPPWVYFQPVDSLIVTQEYYMDEMGIYRARNEFWQGKNFAINCEGFRGREFFPIAADTSSKKLLFIGDSFTWGAHCDSNFCDILEHQPGYVCYNTGISGNDPAQYENIAKHYVPELKPDYTVLMFFLGNDLMDDPREIMPHVDLYYQTNAGWLPTSYKGKYFKSARESYDFVARQYTVSSRWKKMLMKTAIGTAIFSIPLRIKEYADYTRLRKNKVANAYLHRIASICAPYSKLLIFVIPALETDLNDEFYENADAYVKKRYPNLLKGLEDISTVLPMRAEHYWPLPDGHFNYEGHRAAAAFIEEKLDSLL